MNIKETIEKSRQTISQNKGKISLVIAFLTGIIYFGDTGSLKQIIDLIQGLIK